MGLLITGCSEGVDSTTQHQPLVFGKRNVETTRGLFELTRKADFEKELAYNLAALSRANASITLSALNPGMNCSEGNERPNATLFMTSDTRALSAYHVIRRDQTHYGVEFEGSSSQMLPDGPTYTNYDASWEWRTDLRYNRAEEYPFLANRLFSLGLHDWAAGTSGLPARIQLRTGWRFEIETISAADSHHVPNTLWGQGFQPQLPTTSGKDIVLLKAQQLDAPDWQRQSPFPLVSPSVFFDQVEVAKPEHGFPTRNATLEAVYVSPFFPDTNLFVPTSCTNGSYLGTNSDIRKDVCRNVGVLESRVMHDIRRSTVDSAGGTSGGAILGPHRMTFGDGQNPYRFRQAFGVIHGATHPPGAVVPATWSEPDQDSTRFSTAFTSIGNDWKRTDRDGSVPSLPSPVFGPGNQHTGCTEWENRTHVVDGQSYTSEVCVAWGESTTTGSVTNGLPAPAGDSTENTDPDTPQHDTFFKILCGDNYPVRTSGGITIQSDPGAIVGLLGALHLGVDGNRPQPREILQSGTTEIIRRGGGIGSFFQICGPYSSEPFTSNWRFLRIAGNTVDPSWDTLKGPVSWSSLRRALVSKFEERGLPDTTYFRPPSFKTCPPGFLVRGFELGKSGNSHYTGVEKLICVSPDGRDEVEVGTVAPANFDLSLFGRVFSLTQMIGAPSTTTDLTVVQCLASSPIMRGLEMAHDRFGRLTFVQPFCTNRVLP